MRLMTRQMKMSCRAPLRSSSTTRLPAIPSVSIGLALHALHFLGLVVILMAMGMAGPLHCVVIQAAIFGVSPASALKIASVSLLETN